MASASRALLRSKLPAAASRFLRPLAAAALPAARGPLPAAAPLARRFATQPAASSLRDSSPNWSNRPPKETILLDGCDFEHWLVVMEPPPGNSANPDFTREEIIDSYIKTLAQVVGSDEEARMKIYSVSTKYYFAFGALVSEEVSLKLKELPNVRWVLPDSYLDVKNKDYGGEPFINGQPVAYDPKYHEEWVRNNARANERPRRNDRPRSFDPNRQRGGFDRRPAPPSYEAPPPPPPPPGQNQMPAHDAPPMRPAQGPPPNYQPHAPNQQSGYGPGGGPPNYPNAPPPPCYQGGPPSGYQAGTKVTLVVKAQPTKATTVDTRVEEGQVATRRRPLSQVATRRRLLTKVVVLAMVAVHQTTKAKEATWATKAVVTTTAQPHLPSRGGMGQGGNTNREHC